MPVRIKELFNIQRSTTASDERNELSDTISRYPAGRIEPGTTRKAVNRTLQANMTGHVTLSGFFFNINFQNGLMTKLNNEDAAFITKISSRTFIKAGSSRIDYRNQIAFSFDTGDEYGLRSVFVPRNKNLKDRKTIVDYYFNRISDEAFITVNIEYPEFESDERVEEAAAIEMTVSASGDQEIIIGSDMEKDTAVKKEDSICGIISGKTFSINTGEKRISLSLTDAAFEHIEFKSTAAKKRNSVSINVGGSYQAAPASYFSGVTEQFTLKLEVHRS